MVCLVDLPILPSPGTYVYVGLEERKFRDNLKNILTKGVWKSYIRNKEAARYINEVLEKEGVVGVRIEPLPQKLSEPELLPGDAAIVVRRKGGRKNYYFETGMLIRVE